VQRAQPAGAYLAFAGVYLVATAGAWLWLRRHRLTWPQPTFFDFVLLGLATARLSRLITRDKITLPLRAPLTASAAEGEQQPGIRPRGSGLVRAAGELVTCPRCAAVWAASGLTLTYFASPTSARFAGLLLSSSLVSDFVNRGFGLLNEAKILNQAQGPNEAVPGRNQMPQPDRVPRSPTS